MKKKYVSPQELLAEARRFKTISEYSYFTDVSEEDNKDDQLTMDDFNAPPPEGEAPPPPPDQAGGAPPEQQGTPPEDPFGQSGAEGSPEGEMPAEPTGDTDTQEIDVTDIVQDTKAMSEKTDAMTAKVDQTLSKVDGLLNKIQGLEQSVQKMDQAIAKIDSIYKEVELSKPPSPEEVKEVMAQNSYPFNVTLDSYGKEGTPKNQTELEKRKNKLSLSNLLSDFNERELRQSFNPPDPFDDKLSRSLPGYRI
jgi:hypothetical protein